MKSIFIQVTLVLSLIFSLQSVHGQKGSIRIFCEVPGSKMFLDDELKGTDISIIDSVVAGSHYLKVTKDEIIIYGELIQVNSGQVTTILVKDTKELQDKLVAFKPEVVQQYKERKLDIYMDTKYFTATTETTNVKGGAYSVFPGYYSVAGKAETTTISTTYSTSDWFLVEGNKRISELEFAKITNNQAVIDAYEQREIEMDKIRHKKAVGSRITMGITGIPVGGVGAFFLMKGFQAEPGSIAKPMGIIWGSAFAIIGSTMVIMSVATKTSKFENYVKYNVNDLHLISFTDAEKMIITYNQNLKKELGLPLDFEPQQ